MRRCQKRFPVLIIIVLIFGVTIPILLPLILNLGLTIRPEGMNNNQLLIQSPQEMSALEKCIVGGDISPDGSLVAIVIAEGNNKTWTLYSYSLKEKRVYKVSDKVRASPAWDRNDVLWFCEEEEETNFGIYKWWIGASKPVPVLQNGYINPCPSPDGKWLVCSIYPFGETPESPRKIAKLVIYNLVKGAVKEISFEGYGKFPLTPFLYQWTPDGRRLFVFCLQGSPEEGFALFLLKPPSFKPQLVNPHTYPIAERGSWCLKDGSIVFVEVERQFKMPLETSKIPVEPPPGSGFPELPSPTIFTFSFWKFKEDVGKTLLWKENGYNRSFAISLTGRFLLIPREDVDSNKNIYSYLNLVDLSNKKVRRIEREEIKGGLGRVWYHEKLGGFCIVTPTGIFLLKGNGEISTLLSLDKLLHMVVLLGTDKTVNKVVALGLRDPYALRFFMLKTAGFCPPFLRSW